MKTICCTSGSGSVVLYHILSRKTARKSAHFSNFNWHWIRQVVASLQGTFCSMMPVFCVCSLTRHWEVYELLFLKKIAIHYRKSNFKSRFFPFKSYSQVLGIRFAQCHLQCYPGDNMGYNSLLKGSWLIPWIFFSERSHIFDQRNYEPGDVPEMGLASKSVWAKCVFAGFTWFGITSMDYGKMAKFKPHHPLLFQSLHKYSSTIPSWKITSVPLIKLLLSLLYEPGQQLPLWSRTHRKGHLYPKCTAKISPTHLVST